MKAAKEKKEKTAHDIRISILSCKNLTNRSDKRSAQHPTTSQQPLISVLSVLLFRQFLFPQFVFSHSIYTHTHTTKCVLRVI